MDLGRMAVWLHPAVLRAANPLVPHWTTHDRPRAWTARPSVSGVRATAERAERSGSGAGAERERSGSGAGAERERSENGARLRVGKNRFNSVRYN